MVKGHKQDLSDFNMEASNGYYPSVKRAAAEASKTISEHLQMAQ